MAVATASSSLCSKFTNFLFAQSSIQLSTHLPLKPIYPPSLKLRTQIPNSLQTFSPLSTLSNVCLFSAPFDSFQASEGDDEAGEEPESTDPHLEKEEETESKPVPRPGDEEGRLYVGNLPFSMTSSELAEVFAEAGNVVDVQVVYDKVTDRSRGFAFVSMGSTEEAQEAIRMFDGSQIGGRTVKVNFPEVPRGGERAVMGPKIRSAYRSFVDSPHKLYAGNLGWGLTSQGLREAFAGQPGFLSAKVIYDRGSGRSRGFGFVSFESAEDAESALNAMNGVEVEGRPLRLSMAAERVNVSRPPAHETDMEENIGSSEMLSGINS